MDTPVPGATDSTPPPGGGECPLCHHQHSEVPAGEWCCPDHGHHIVWTEACDYEDHYQCPEPGCTYGRWFS